MTEETTATEAPLEQRRLYPVAAAAHSLGISERTCWDLIWTGQLPTKWIGKRRLVPAEDLDKYVADLPYAPHTEVATA